MIALHPDVGEGAEPAGSSLQAGFFMSAIWESRDPVIIPLCQSPPTPSPPPSSPW